MKCQFRLIKTIQFAIPSVAVNIITYCSNLSLPLQHEPYSPTLSLLPMCVQNNSSTWQDHTTRVQYYKRCAYSRSFPQPLPTQTSTQLPDHLLLSQVFMYYVLNPSGRSTTQCRLWSESQQHSVPRPTAVWGEINTSRLRVFLLLIDSAECFLVDVFLSGAIVAFTFTWAAVGPAATLAESV